MIPLEGVALTASRYAGHSGAAGPMIAFRKLSASGIAAPAVQQHCSRAHPPTHGRARPCKSAPAYLSARCPPPTPAPGSSPKWVPRDLTQQQVFGRTSEQALPEEPRLVVQVGVRVAQHGDSKI